MHVAASSQQGPVAVFNSLFGSASLPTSLREGMADYNLVKCYVERICEDSAGVSTTTAPGAWECADEMCLGDPYAPVCADGVEYPNECWARCFGVLSFHLGKLQPYPRALGGARGQ